MPGLADPETGPYFYAERMHRRVFVLPGERDRSIDIKSQIERATELVEALAEHQSKYFTLPHHRLLIVGSGAAGVAAAVAGASRGMPVTLWGNQGIPFGAQANCRTRRLHPNQYQWPENGWDVATWELKPGHPLKWTFAPSHKVAKAWTRRFERFRAGHKRLVVDYNKGFRIPNNAESFIQRVDAVHEPEFSAILFCTGFWEDCTLVFPGTRTEYLGYQFWATDPFEKARTRRRGQSPGRILISGAGDGGLQDLLRIAFGKPPFAVVQELERAFRPDRAAAWNNFLQQVLLAEHAGLPPAALYQADVAAIGRLLDEADGWAVVKPVFSSLLQYQFLQNGFVIVDKAGELPRCFVLNRVLSLLLAEYVQRTASTKLFHFNSQVTDLKGPSAHRCQNDPAQCNGKLHQVTFSNGPDASSYHTIIVRHGIRRRIAPRPVVP